MQKQFMKVEQKQNSICNWFIAWLNGDYESHWCFDLSFSSQEIVF